MYFPLFLDKPSERQACGRLYLNVNGCCPVVKINLPPLEQQLPLFRKKLQLWVRVAERVNGVGFLVDGDCGDRVAKELCRLDWTRGMRLAVAAHQRKKLWLPLKAVHDRHHSGGIVLLNPGDTADSGLMRWIRDKQKVLPLVTIVAFGDVSKRAFATELDHAKTVLGRFAAAGIQRPCFLAGSYPKDNADFSTGKVTLVPRVEWSIYQHLAADEEYSFGDYGPQHFEPRDPPDGSPVKVAPAIRYTTEEGWRVHRGNTLPWDKWRSQMRALAREIVDADYYAKDFFSWGDSQLDKCAAGAISPPGNWQPIRTIEINHHLTHCAAATARLFGELTPPATPVAAGGP